MFADDTNITISSFTPPDLKQVTNSELMTLCCCLQANNLSLSIAKPEFMVIGSRQKPLSDSYDVINIWKPASQ